MFTFFTCKLLYDDDGTVFYSPYFGQILNAWERAKSEENVLFLFYEDLKKVLIGEMHYYGVII